MEGGIGLFYVMKAFFELLYWILSSKSDGLSNMLDYELKKAKSHEYDSLPPEEKAKKMKELFG